MTTEQHYDAIVIGSGQGGKPLAGVLAGAGHKTAIIEREHVGGSCVNVGCTPTKTMIASARTAYVDRRSADYGVHNGPVTVEMTEVRQRKQDIVDKFRDGVRQIIESTKGLDLFLGEARFTGPKELQVDLNDGETVRVSADNVFINVGARPLDPPIEGLDSVPTLDSTSIMELDEVPDHLLVLGGGYVGLEFAQMFRRFGSEVTIVQRGEQLLAREDEDVAEAVAEILREDGIEVLLETEALRAEQNSDGELQLTVQTPDEERTLSGSHLLVAIGRPPNTDSLDLDAAGVQADERGFVGVNERLETNVPGVYVLGDAKSGPAFTHISYDDFRIINTNLLEGGDATITDRLVSYVVYIDPQLGRVGMSEREAREQGRDVQVAKMPMTHVPRALEMDETRGMMKAVVDTDTGRILGCTILGIEGGEIMSMVHIAMMGDLPYTALRDGPFAHPTLAESLNKLFATLDW
ncbi:MAG: PF00070 family, FAD-dependent NAD(P)-disulphide oxidoreductase [uncultured Rubrobacteraceae bacterium]|uniref:PF00070 family, FAD-dependent NAD(P)-disulphide oxidoreductase n=1 Tax=uncultured Rubrobacteraceae bacterium TaxID=349277 RepID=A0A6J4QFW7_9ACTN|nr:MAG: PF00070 family, FAD-dependent NAD(P)-disulphide oxidoreductase [uncultured Rubrobacteraceae bacterium]